MHMSNQIEVQRLTLFMSSTITSKICHGLFTERKNSVEMSLEGKWESFAGI
jgi:hypothetical protein